MIWCGWKSKENWHVLVNQFHGNIHSKTLGCRKIKSVLRDVKWCFNASWGLKGLKQVSRFVLLVSTIHLVTASVFRMLSTLRMRMGPQRVLNESWRPTYFYAYQMYFMVLVYILLVLMYIICVFMYIHSKQYRFIRRNPSVLSPRNLRRTLAGFSWGCMVIVLKGSF